MKRAQITIYIILGLILMLSIAFVAYLAQKKAVAPTEVLIIPEEAKPLHEFVTTCLTQAAQSALVQLGLQGGYLTIPREIQRTPTAFLSLDQNNNFKLPYWYYDGEDRTPSLQDMENQVSKYLFDAATQCTNQFTQFQPSTVQILEQITPHTIIGDEDVAFKIHWPLQIKIGDRTTKIEDFAFKLPVKLKQAWQLADSVMKAENKLTFFENRTIDFMSADDNIPTDGLVFQCGQKRWHLQEIKQELQNILHYNIPYVRVENTNYIPFNDKPSTYRALAKARTSMLNKLEQGITLDQQTPPSNIPDDAYEYFKMTMQTDNPPTNLKASFSYLPEWGIMLAAQPIDGQVLKSNLGKGIQKYLSFICINQWHFTYDIIYPVKLTIKDENAFLNKGYLFQTAFPVLINSNAPDRIFFGIQKFPQPLFGGDFCTTPSDQIVDIRAKGFIQDAPIAVELPDTNITYKCFNQYCDLGTTTADEGYYRLRTTLPQGCNNPIITATKDGYLPTESVMTNNQLSLQLTRLKKINVTIVIHPYNLQEQKYLETTTTLLPNQRISLHIYLKNSTFEQYTEYPRTTQLQIVDGKASYDIEALLISNDQTIGGYFADAVNVTYSDIADKNNLVLNLIEFRPHPANTQKQGEMTQFLYTNDAYKKELRPAFI